MDNNFYLRPEFHFTPKKGWMNDPNGLIYEAATGQYHLFFQYCHTLEEDQLKKWWGHAVSTDLIHWSELPPAISPDELGGAWSGCCVEDGDNTSGLFDDAISGSRLVAIYTGAGPHPEFNYQKQLIAYSTDHGLTWQKYAGNPVIASRPGDSPSFDNRDPSVFRLAFPDGNGGTKSRWVMMIAGMWARLFVSGDLIHWQFCGDVFRKDGSHLESECPDLFPMQVNGDPERTVWVYSGAGRFFVVGRLEAQIDGSVRFVSESDTVELNEGSDVMYAAQTYNNIPDGRRIFVYWMVDKSAKQLAAQGYTKEWDGFQSLPMEATLIERGGQYRLAMRPVKEYFSALRRRTLASGTISSAKDIIVCQLPGSCELRLKLPCSRNGKVSAEGRGQYPWRVDVRADGTVSIDGGRPVPMVFDGNGVDGTLELMIIRDGACLDVFSSDGGHAHTLILPRDRNKTDCTECMLLLTADAPTEYCLNVLELPEGGEHVNE